MNGIRKLFLLAAVAMMLAPLTPAYGATKQYNATLSPTAGGATFTLNNLSSGNSVIKSWTLTAPTGYKITSAATVAPYSGTISPACSVASPCTSIQVNYATGIQPLTLAQVALGITAPTASSCSQSPVWATAAYTGNNVGGQPFQDQGPPTTLANTTGCALEFVTQPGNGQVNTAITSTVGGSIQVRVKDSGGITQTWFNGGITLTSAGPGTGTLTGGGPANAVSGVASFSQLKLSAPGLYALSAAASGFTSTTSNQFTIFAGVLNCQPTPPFEFGDVAGDEDQPGNAAGLRWFWNKDGLSCIPLLYSFNNYILTPDPITGIGNAVQLTWDTTTGQHPAFMYSATFKPEDVDNANKGADSLGPSNYGWPVPRRAFVAFNTVGAPNFVPGLACISNKLPAPYASLQTSIGPDDTVLTVTSPQNVPAGYPTATFPASGQFPIVIGTERMLVTGVAGNQLTVSRRQGGTGLPAVGHDASAYVMSTPLPLDPNSGMQIPICVVKHGWVAEGLNPTTGVPQISWVTTVFDLGDSWIIPR